MSGLRRQLGVALVLCAGLLLAPSAFAADAGTSDTVPDDAVDATFTQTTSPEKPIEAGETVTVTLQVDHPAGAAVEIPDSFEPARWIVVDTASTSTSQEGSGSTTWAVTFGIYRPGTTTLQPFAVQVVDTEGHRTQLNTEPVTVKVLSRFADAETEPSFLPPRPPVEVWVEDMTLAWVGGGGALLALLGLFLFAAARREAMRPAPPPPPRAPHEVALEKLGALAGDDLVERGEYMIFWVRLSEAIREYLGRTYGFAPTELTTSEILDELHTVYWPPGLDLEDVAEFLRHCDQVKFAGREPGLEESSQTLRRAFSIVELTRPGTSAASLTGSESATDEGADAVPSESDGEKEAPSPRDDDENRWAPPSDAKPGGEEEE